MSCITARITAPTLYVACSMNRNTPYQAFRQGPVDHGYFFIALLSLFLVAVTASENGLLYVCDASILSSSNMCVFTASSSNIVGASPHVIDRRIGGECYRAVSDSQGTQLTVSPKPWTQGDKIIASESQLSENLWNYYLAFELVAPLRNAAMYSPSDIATSQAEWDKLTKAFVDCQVKAQDESMTTPNEGSKTIYSVDSIYELIKDAEYEDMLIPPQSSPSPKQESSVDSSTIGSLSLYPSTLATFIIITVGWFMATLH
ncbi:hypothetical protein CYMTET_49185 [Cymbomonas tetramitiformis]|uniref:Uncharacterized protein n=1 Tax=Cymbomonas tetramitiformis TaxID=36881 RepID=A0AAE0BSD7_9CHLO|nr:hypothetical protein CYMTET_49185 [Cymbomonas tetramitiformis]